MPIVSLLGTDGTVSSMAPLLAIPLSAYALASAAGSQFATAAGGFTVASLPYAVPIFTASMPMPMPDDFGWTINAIDLGTNDIGWTAYSIDLSTYGVVSSVLIIACALMVHIVRR